MDRKRPGGLLLVIVAGFALGGLGSCAGTVSIASLFVQPKLQELTRTMAEMSSAGDPALYDQQLRMQEELEAVQAGMRPAVLAHQVGNLLASIALVAACVMLLRWSPRALGIFTIAALLSIVVDAAGGGLQLWVQRASSEVLQRYMTDLGSGAPPGAERAMGTLMSASANAGICFGLAWTLAKLGAYVGSLVYLRKADVRALFAQRP